MARRDQHPYRAIFRKDPKDPLGLKINSPRGYGTGYVGAVHKRAMEDRPYRLVNELLCGQMAQALLLPCPPFAITLFQAQKDVNIRNEYLFSSLDFDFERDSSPPPDFELCWQRMPNLCAGILAFDILVANPDRIREHIWCDDTEKPSRLLIFDHDSALLETEGGERCRAIRASESLGLHFGHLGDNHHPFLKKIDSARLLDEWYNRIALVPRWYVEQAVQDAQKYGMNAGEAADVTELLLHRSRNLRSIVEANRSEFPKVLDW
jgi:hypothetical protein